MKLDLPRNTRHNFSISFQYFLYYNKSYKRPIKQHYIGWLCCRKCH